MRPWYVAYPQNRCARFKEQSLHPEIFKLKLSITCEAIKYSQGSIDLHGLLLYVLRHFINPRHLLSGHSSRHFFLTTSPHPSNAEYLPELHLTHEVLVPKSQLRLFNRVVFDSITDPATGSTNFKFLKTAASEGRLGCYAYITITPPEGHYCVLGSRVTSYPFLSTHSRSLP